MSHTHETYNVVNVASAKARYMNIEFTNKLPTSNVARYCAQDVAIQSSRSVVAAVDY